MGDQTNRIEKKIDWIIQAMTPQPEQKETEKTETKTEKKEIKQRPTVTE